MQSITLLTHHTFAFLTETMLRGERKSEEGSRTSALDRAQSMMESLLSQESKLAVFFLFHCTCCDVPCVLCLLKPQPFKSRGLPQNKEKHKN